MNINVIGVPIFYGCDNNGTQFGPDRLRNKGLCEKLKSLNFNVHDLGNISVPYLDKDFKLNSNGNMKYYNEILEVNRNLAHSVFISVSSDCFPLIIGGDHSIGIGSISGVSKYYENLGVVWIDAHGDFNTPEISNSHNVHGMSLAFAAGYGDENFNNIYYDGVKVKTKNIFHIGARDLDDKEIELMSSTDMSIYNSELLHSKGVDYVIYDIINKIKDNKIDALHISFDIDFIDSTLVPGTGTRVENGFDINTTVELLKKLFETKKVVSMDVVELNTLLDIEDKTTNLTLDIIEKVFESIK